MPNLDQAAVAQFLDDLLQKKAAEILTFDTQIKMTIIVQPTGEFFFVIAGGKIRLLPFQLLKSIKEYSPEHAEDVCSQIGKCAVNAVRALYQIT